jgi:leucine rich repeat domain protein
MKKNCNFRKGIFAVLVAASAVVGCSKSNNDEPVTPPTPTDLGSYYMELTTGKTVGEKVDLYMEVNEEDEAGVWLDLNGNGKWDEGIDQKPTEFGENIEYTLQAQTFRIYGKVFFIDCKGNLLKAIDISHNPALTDLDARNNKITSIMYSESLKALYIDSHTLPVSSLPKGLTYLNVKETTPLTTINTSSLTELQVLSAEGCSSLKSLDLSKNEKLTSLHIDGTGLTTLDLSHQPQLTFFYASLTPLTMLNVAGNKALKSVKIQLTQEGEGLQGEALMDFLRQLPTRKKGEEGNIVLNPTQATEEVKSLLTGKFWNVSLVN